MVDQVRVYLHGYLGADYDQIMAPIVDDDHEVHVLDPSMSPQEIYNEILEADVVILQHNDEDSERGTALGLALAFGKTVYVIASTGARDVWLRFEDVRVYDDLYDLLPDVRAALKEIAEDDGSQLDDGRDAGDVPGRDPGTT